MSSKPFESDLVMKEQISEATLRCYNVGFDENKFRLEPLVNVIAEVIAEFAFGPHIGKSVPMTKLRQRLKQAAEKVYTTDKYRQRGEFGELILHLLLRDWCDTIPLISKIYFKDAHNVTIHGFDGVHVTTIENKKKLWLGESKLYTDGNDGVKDLAKDLKTHIANDYLKKEFALIAPKLPESTPDIEHWRELLHHNQSMDKILDGICIPMVCTYSSTLFSKHTDNTQAFLDDFVSDCKALCQAFEDKKIQTSVDVLLLLLPVPSKDDLNANIDKRLKHMQAI